MSYMDDLHAKANKIYAYRRLGEDVIYRAPETLPTIQSNQVMAIFEVLIEEISTLKEQLNQFKK